MNWLNSAIKTILPRLLAAGAGILVGKAAQKGLTLDPTEVTGIMLAGYATIHKVISSKVNPGDAANGRVATAEKVAADTGTTVKVAPKL